MYVEYKDIRDFSSVFVLPGTSLPNRPAESLLRLTEVDSVEPYRTTTLSVRFRGMCLALEHLLR